MFHKYKKKKKTFKLFLNNLFLFFFLGFIHSCKKFDIVKFNLQVNERDLQGMREHSKQVKIKPLLL